MTKLEFLGGKVEKTISRSVSADTYSCLKIGLPKVSLPRLIRLQIARSLDNHYQKQKYPFLAAESSGWGWGFGGGGGTEEFVESFVPADNKTYEGPEFQEDAQIKVEYVANEHDIYDMKQIKGQEISDGNCGVFNSPQKTN